jgi:hypothetical protein
MLKSDTSVQTAAWDCATTVFPYSTTASHLGLMTSYMCYRVGVNKPPTVGFWFYKAVNSTLSAAVCCS